VALAGWGDDSASTGTFVGVGEVQGLAAVGVGEAVGLAVVGVGEAVGLAVVGVGEAQGLAAVDVGVAVVGELRGTSVAVGVAVGV
jgi:hypothetical protein